MEKLATEEYTRGEWTTSSGRAQLDLLDSIILQAKALKTTILGYQTLPNLPK